MIELLLYPLLASLAIATIAGPLGTFIVWQRMAYFGESLAHAGLLGISIGLLVHIHPLLAVLGSCAAFTLAFVMLGRNSPLANDSLLGVLSYTLLAAGLTVFYYTGQNNSVLESILFGDILGINDTELVCILGVTLGACGLLIMFWQPLLNITVHAEIAAVEGVPVQRYRLLLMFIIAATVAVGIKVAGALLMTAMLVIPAATASLFARSPSRMAIGASLLAYVAVIAGLGLSWLADLPAGPAMVLVIGCLFFTATLYRQLRDQNPRVQT